MIGLDLGNLLVHLKADSTQYDRQLKKAVTTMRIVSRRIIGIARGMALRVGAAFSRFGHFISRWAKRLGIALVAVGVMSVKAFASFDDAMIKSLAIMGNVSEGMQQKMRDLARTLSKEGVTSATDLAKSYFFLASAGLTAEQSLAALSTVEAFAVAGAFDMAEATDLLTDAQSALGLTVSDSVQNMKNMTRVSDVLIGANTLANASTRQFAQALTGQAGPAMKAYNIRLEEGVAVLAAYADQGIKGQLASSMFGRMIRLTTKGFIENRAAWKKFSINIFDARGELVTMANLIKQLSKALGNLSTKQKIVALDMLGFQARSQQAILPLLGLGDSVEEYTRKLDKMNKITKELQKKQLKSFSSQMKTLWNNIKDVGITIGEKLVPEIIKLSDWFINNQNTIKEWATKFADKIIFVKNELWEFIKFLRTNFYKGIELGLNITLALFEGFGKSIVAIMKTAAIEAANIFTQIYGERIGRWLIEKSGIMGQTTWETFRDYPLSGAFRGEMLKFGVKLMEGAEAPPMITNLKEDLEKIIDDTKKEITLLKKLSGIDVFRECKERERKLLEKLNPSGGDELDIPTVYGAGSGFPSKTERMLRLREEKIKRHFDNLRRDIIFPEEWYSKKLDYISHAGKYKEEIEYQKKSLSRYIKSLADAQEWFTSSMQNVKDYPNEKWAEEGLKDSKKAIEGWVKDILETTKLLEEYKADLAKLGAPPQIEGITHMAGGGYVITGEKIKKQLEHFKAGLLIDSK